MKLFGWKAAGRASARSRERPVVLSRGGMNWRGGDRPRSYEAQLREGYLNNPIAQRAVRLVAEGVAATPITSSDDALTPLITATSGGQSLLETLATHLLLHGNGYVQILKGADGRPCELFALRPDRVSVEADAFGWPGAYLYRVGDRATRLTSEELIHIRTHHPLDDHYGQGCLGAASGEIGRAHV